MNDDTSSALGKDVNNALYEQDKASRIAKAVSFSSVDKMNTIVAEIRQEMLAMEDFNVLETSVEDDDAIIIANQDEANEDVTNIIETALNHTNNSDETIETALDATSNEIDTIINSGVNTNAVEEVGEQVSKNISIFTTASKTLGISTKVAKATNKFGGKLVKFGKNNLNIFDANGKVDSVNASTNQIKTFARFVGRNTVVKPTKYVGKKINTKITQKPIKTVTKKIAKVEQKAIEKTAKTSVKFVNKIITVVIKVISKIIQGIIEFAITCLPIFAISVGGVLIVVICLSVFGGGMDDDMFEKYSDYMNKVQTSFQAKTLDYYNDGYKVDGTYNGIAYINWQAALSTLQILQPDLNASKSEFNVLDDMKNDGVMYTITETTTTEYIRKEKNITPTVTANAYSVLGTDYVVYNVSGNLDLGYSLDSMTLNGTAISKSNVKIVGTYYSYSFTEYNTTNIKTYTASVHEVVKTTKKYVVTVGTLDDYKEWVNDNYSVIVNFYDEEGIDYDNITVTFLTDSYIEQVDTLYNSSEFGLLFEEAGITMGSDVADGTIYDTGEHSGELAYPTTYRTISAGFPKYPSGKEHTGIDFPAPTGTPVCACADGEVVVVKELDYSYGYYVVLKHNINGKTLYTLYAHNSALKVSVGQTVKQGQVIALSGSTGNSTGPHCHLSVLTSWSPQNYVQPLDYL